MIRTSLRAHGVAPRAHVDAIVRGALPGFAASIAGANA